MPERSNATSQVMAKGSLIQHVLQCIMQEVSDWQRTIDAAASDLGLSDNKPVMGFDTTKIIPQSVTNQLGLTVVDGKTWSLSPRKEFADRSLSSRSQSVIPEKEGDSHYGDNEIAVIGMACKFPGADSIKEFWDLLSAGSSMLSQMPAERFSIERLRRTPDGKFRFLETLSATSLHSIIVFFKKSSREAASMDPQQRLLLQCACEAGHGHFLPP